MALAFILFIFVPSQTNFWLSCTKSLKTEWNKKQTPDDLVLSCRCKMIFRVIVDGYEMFLNSLKS